MAKKAKVAKLTAKQEHFAHLVAKGLSGTEAAKQAGFAAVSAHVRASRMLKIDKVAARVAEIRNNISNLVAEKSAIDKTWVIDQLVENVSMAKQAIAVTDREGHETGEYEQNLAAANRALELIGKEIGMFVDRKEIRTGKLDHLSPEDQATALEAVEAAIREQQGAVEKARASAKGA